MCASLAPCKPYICFIICAKYFLVCNGLSLSLSLRLYRFLFHFIHFIVDDKTLCCFAMRHIILFLIRKQQRKSVAIPMQQVRRRNAQLTIHTPFIYIYFIQHDVNSFLLIHCCIAFAWENMKQDLLQIRNKRKENRNKMRRPVATAQYK